MFCIKDPDGIPCQPLGQSERQKKEAFAADFARRKAKQEKDYRDFQFEQLRHELPVPKKTAPVVEPTFSSHSFTDFKLAVRQHALRLSPATMQAVAKYFLKTYALAGLSVLESCECNLQLRSCFLQLLEATKSGQQFR